MIIDSGKLYIATDTFVVASRPHFFVKKYDVLICLDDGYDPYVSKLIRLSVTFLDLTQLEKIVIDPEVVNNFLEPYNLRAAELGRLDAAVRKLYA